MPDTYEITTTGLCGHNLSVVSSPVEQLFTLLNEGGASPILVNWDANEVRWFSMDLEKFADSVETVIDDETLPAGKWAQGLGLGMLFPTLNIYSLLYRVRYAEEEDVTYARLLIHNFVELVDIEQTEIAFTGKIEKISIGLTGDGRVGFRLNDTVVIPRTALKDFDENLICIPAAVYANETPLLTSGEATAKLITDANEMDFSGVLMPPNYTHKDFCGNNLNGITYRDEENFILLSEQGSRDGNALVKPGAAVISGDDLQTFSMWADNAAFEGCNTITEPGNIIPIDWDEDEVRVIQVEIIKPTYSETLLVFTDGNGDMFAFANYHAGSQIQIYGDTIYLSEPINSLAISIDGAKNCRVHWTEGVIHKYSAPFNYANPESLSMVGMALKNQSIESTPSPSMRLITKADKFVEPIGVPTGINKVCDIWGNEL